MTTGRINQVSNFQNQYTLAGISILIL